MGTSGGGSERRRQRRIHVSLPITVRGVDANGVPFEEIIHSYDVSRGGASFPSLQRLEMGAELEVTIPRRIPGREELPDFITTGIVVRLIENKDGSRQVSVKFVGPQFPTYVSEAAS